MSDPKLTRKPAPPITPNQPLARPPLSETTGVSTVVSDDEIRHHAYQLYKSRGGCNDHAVEDWLAAEAHLKARKNRANKTIAR